MSERSRDPSGSVSLAQFRRCGYYVMASVVAVVSTAVTTEPEGSANFGRNAIHGQSEIIWEVSRRDLRGAFL